MSRIMICFLAIVFVISAVNGQITAADTLGYDPASMHIAPFTTEEFDELTTPTPTGFDPQEGRMLKQHSREMRWR